MATKASWSAEDLENLHSFTEAFQNFLQDWTGTVPIKDAMVVLAEHTAPWGVVSISDFRDLLVQFEPGEFDIGTL